MRMFWKNFLYYKTLINFDIDTTSDNLIENHSSRKNTSVENMI